MHPALDPRILGWAMSAFFGGRAEARLVRTIAPVVPVDATAMYSLVNALLGTWRILTARDVGQVDATSEVRRLLARDDLLERCLDRAFWARSIGVTLVELEDPTGSILPIRAKYDPHAPDPGIGVNPFYYQGRLWYMLPDVIGSVLLSGIVPRVRRAIRLVGYGRQSGLREVQLRGARRVDPEREDPFVAMVEERQRIKQDRSISPGERERLQQFLKVTASATAYGGQARFDRRELTEDVSLLIYGPDDRPRRKGMPVVEDPGPYSFPPVAASITAGARLMLALVERMVSEAGGAYVYADTDAMAICATERGGWLECPTEDGSGRIRALSFDAVRHILRRFRDLNPFDPKLVPDLWKVEHESMSAPLWCYAISAKRYALFHLSEDRRPDLVAVGEELAEAQPEESGAEDGLTVWSEHGLGLYQSPLVDERRKALRDDSGRLVWIREAWTWILERVLGGDPPPPSWADTYALTQFSLSTPAVASWFRGRDKGIDPAERMRPASFGLIAHPQLKSGPLPAAPFESDPRRWPDLNWYDRTTGHPIRVLHVASSIGPDRLADMLSRGYVPIRTLGDVLLSYATRPEHKSLAPDGSATTSTTVGLLQRRPVKSSPVLTELTGKEGNKLIDRASGAVRDPALYRNDYGRRVEVWTLAVSVLQGQRDNRLVAARSGVPLRTVQRLVRRSAIERPRSRHAASLEWAAVELVKECLPRPGLEAPSDELTVLHRYETERRARGRALRCACGCGRALPPGRTRWWSESCRLRSYRKTRIPSSKRSSSE
jgi:hypothetical protein